MICGDPAKARRGNVAERLWMRRARGCTRKVVSRGGGMGGQGERTVCLCVCGGKSGESETRRWGPALLGGAKVVQKGVLRHCALDCA